MPISQGALIDTRKTLGSLMPHPANIGKIVGAHLGISAPRRHLASGGHGGIAQQEDLSSNIFAPITPSSSIPNADVNFITSPQLSGGKGAPPAPTSTPEKEPDSMQQISEGTQAANGLTSAYKGISGSNGILAGTGSNPSLFGSIKSGIGGNGWGGVLGGPNAQTALADGTNGFAPGMSLDTLGSGASSAVPAGVVGQAIDASAVDALPVAADAVADAATAAGSTAATSGFFDWLGSTLLAALPFAVAKGGAVPEYAAGGNVLPALGTGKDTFHPSGLLNSAGPGRTDTINTNVPAGAYVIPADVVSGIGDGNTLAGSAVIDRMFASSPHGIKSPQIRRGSGSPRASSPAIHDPDSGPSTVDTQFINSAGAYAKGGSAYEKSPVVVAGGEHVISPEQIINKFGSLKKGHATLDRWVLLQREKHIKDLKGLDAPVGSRVKKGEK